jgi:16S rRNA (cytosine1402-N4)-methyltransferase
LNPEAAMGSLHRPVLLNEIVAWLTPEAGKSAIIVDGTAGGGGHTVALARRLGGGGRLIGLDRDPAMLILAENAVREADPPLPVPVSLVHASYQEMRRVLDDLGIEQVQGVLLDLGLSSDQLAWTSRGFSFANDGPLDMRFDPDGPDPSASDLVNQMQEAELARLFFELGEERFSRRIARRIVEARKARRIETTGQLAELVRRSVPGPKRHGPIDPATRVFQALRIAVNDELGQLEATLGAIPDLLSPGGRAGVISFHSLEDRRVKWGFKTDTRLTVLTKKPVTASAQEVAVNPRARSAKLRVVERCPNPS